MVELFYTNYISVNLAHCVIYRAKVGKGSIVLLQIKYLHNMYFLRTKGEF